ncbi:MAG: hypothetical protein PVJ53_02020 [Desulfobacterales bacterium]|jgi:hypothetical protein
MTVKINCEETNLEILARIAKAAARKYDCSLTIDFQNGERRIEFIGSSKCKAQIADTVENYFKATADSEASDDPRGNDNPQS